MKDVYVYRCPFCGLWRVKTSSNISYSKVYKTLKKRGWGEGDIKATPLCFSCVDIDHDPMVIWKRGKAILGKWNIYEAYINADEEGKQQIRSMLVEILEQCNKIKAIASEVFGIKI